MVDIVKRGAYRGHSFVRLYGGNLSSLLSVVNGKVATVCGARNRLLRQLQHTLRWSGILVEMLWVKGEFNLWMSRPAG